ncbi:MAG: M16 family metallopeptidase [Bacteriovoracaceae bacterium]
MKYISLALFLFSVQSFASFKKPEIHIYDWNGIDVVYLEDNKLPLYDVIFYFADGSLSDTHIKGETEAMFDNLDLGTRRFSRNDIQDNLEFFGVSYSSFVTHEYTTFSFSGLVKDIVPTTKKICHLFSDATFRASELKKEKKKYINSLQNLVSSPSGLASRAFRELSLKETPFYYPTEGKLRDIKKINTRGLKRKLSYFNKKVKKRIYLSGPKSILDVKSIILKECGWDIETSTVVRREPLKEKKISNNGPEIHLVTVPQSNQAQVLIGRHLLPEEYTNQELMTLSSGFLGGGFTSKLMRAVRVKRGLTYGISSFAAGQKEYGRLGISSSTKNETVIEMLDVIKDEIEKIGEGKF